MHYGVRIIPARAGFTPHRPSGPSRRPDHPRSRGVYSTVSLASANTADHPRSRGVYHHAPDRRDQAGGSSPLARGLHGRFGEWGVGMWIIPARAGFTGTAVSPRRRPLDHPRSRGVYRSQAAICAIVAGSSPLARGLRHHSSPAQEHGGIIPARAGFTRHAVGDDSGPWDHPRSRGVYR